MSIQLQLIDVFEIIELNSTCFITNSIKLCKNLDDKNKYCYKNTCMRLYSIKFRIFLSTLVIVDINFIPEMGELCTKFKVFKTKSSLTLQ